MNYVSESVSVKGRLKDQVNTRISTVAKEVSESVSVKGRLKVYVRGNDDFTFSKVSESVSVKGRLKGSRFRVNDW